LDFFVFLCCIVFVTVFLEEDLIFVSLLRDFIFLWDFFVCFWQFFIFVFLRLQELPGQLILLPLDLSLLTQLLLLLLLRVFESASTCLPLLGECLDLLLQVV